MKLHEFVDKEMGKILGFTMLCGGLACAGIIGDKYTKNHNSLVDLGMETNGFTYEIPYTTNPILVRTNYGVKR